MRCVGCCGGASCCWKLDFQKLMKGTDGRTGRFVMEWKNGSSGDKQQTVHLGHTQLLFCISRTKVSKFTQSNTVEKVVHIFIHFVCCYSAGVVRDTQHESFREYQRNVTTTLQSSVDDPCFSQ